MTRDKYRDTLLKLRHPQLCEVVAIYKNAAVDAKAYKMTESQIIILLMGYWDAKGASKVIKGLIWDKLGLSRAK